MKIDELLLYSGQDIPFPEGQLIIHQPKIKEIAMIGEINFRIGCELLNFSKNKINAEDRSRLEEVPDFDILMSIMTHKDIAFTKQVLPAKMLLGLLFPDYKIAFQNNTILFKREDEIGFINGENFSEFKKAIIKILELNHGNTNTDYNPAGPMASRIAEKFRKRRDILSKKKGEEVSSFYGRYISILSVAQQKNVNDLFNYTIYQLFDEFERFNLKLNNDYYIQAKMAGATGMKEVDDWTQDIHIKKQDNFKGGK